MKPTIEIVPCVCYTPEHQIIFHFDDFYNDFSPHNAEESVYLGISIFLYNYRNIFKRTWVALKYIFGYKCKYGDWDGMEIDYDTATKMIKTLQTYKDRVDSYKTTGV